MKHWKEKYSAGGVCDFRENYDFYFKWLLNKVCSCFVVNGLPDTINQTYLKSELIMQGMCCITDFGGELYACTGSLGGQPDEYYIPTVFVIANPVLGSKQVERGRNGVVIFNTGEDMLYAGTFCAGLYQLINQTATLLADNIISINANQINSRVCAFFTADSEAKAVAGETILKKMYAGRPYQILRTDLVEKIQVNPISTAATSSNITELIELQNYIISNFMQSIGIKANDLRKRERMITDEINSQNDYLQLSVTEILSSWQKGFDEVNKMYGTEIHVTLNPALLDLLLDEGAEQNDEQGIPESEEDQPAEEKAEAEKPENTVGAEAPEAETVTPDEEAGQPDPEAVAEEIEQKNEAVEIIAKAAGGDLDADSESVLSEESENMAGNAAGDRTDGS